MILMQLHLWILGGNKMTIEEFASLLNGLDHRNELTTMKVLEAWAIWKIR